MPAFTLYLLNIELFFYRKNFIDKILFPTHLTPQYLYFLYQYIKRLFFLLRLFFTNYNLIYNNHFIGFSPNREF